MVELKTFNLQDRAYHQLVDDIVMTRLIPGTKISEKDLVKKMGVGRTPIREALLRLRNNGLIYVVPQSGTYISKINLNVALNARYIRKTLESQVVRESVPLFDDTSIVNLSKIIQKETQFAHAEDFESFFSTDESFHEFFYKVSGREQVWVWLQTVNMQLNRFRWLRLKVSNLPWEIIIKEHKEIFDATKKGDAEAASRLSSEHLNLMKKEENQLINTFPDYFSFDN
ncbi:GntR family transcriptional regulator [Oenococcus oeni]|uniref:GntR family transcriptional regulator n=1 Tax=Oenococcus oeni TaxID=1247 RepID=UPI0008F81939|nr:GntR family transcriptional regulator [Oenococcus oeni]OIK85857.1 hypothetical protein ATW79_07590 [Oenococcus oeni]OIL08069.1 hypothetical protein ATW92_07640 [Oenococcus oeni]OIL11311.1 hypothetical protein ATW93_09565 [Oenococcus oeni]SYW12225.1 Gntr family transcription regulator [Oenococcus oeni]SYW15689.1 Gntr family transcription regulator [Oenococcus oeni]